MSNPEAGWYPCPGNPSTLLRYWNGEAWTESTKPKNDAPAPTGAPIGGIQMQQATGTRLLDQAHDDGFTAFASAEPTRGSSGRVESHSIAGFGVRLAGSLVDGFVMGLVMWASIFVMMFASSVLGGGLALAGFGLVMLAGLVGPFLYQSILIAKSGQTIGRSIVDIRVQMADGGPVPFGRAALRTLASGLSGMFFSLGYLWMLWDEEGRTWHDIIAGTVVVRV